IAPPAAAFSAFSRRTTISDIISTPQVWGGEAGSLRVARIARTLASACSRVGPWGSASVDVAGDWARPEAAKTARAIVSRTQDGRRRERIQVTSRGLHPPFCRHLSSLTQPRAKR